MIEDRLRDDLAGDVQAINRVRDPGCSPAWSGL